MVHGTGGKVGEKNKWYKIFFVAFYSLLVFPANIGYFFIPALTLSFFYFVKEIIVGKKLLPYGCLLVFVSGLMIFSFFYYKKEESLLKEQGHLIINGIEKYVDKAGSCPEKLEQLNLEETVRTSVYGYFCNEKKSFFSISFNLGLKVIRYNSKDKNWKDQSPYSR